LVEISEFSKDRKEVVFETKQGKISLSFDEWKHIADVYDEWIKKV